MNFKLINPVAPDLSITEQILYNRGVTDMKYLETTDDDLLAPELLENMREGAILLTQHLSKGSKILVQVDSDCDGYTSAAALINYLNYIAPAFVASNMFYQLHQGKEHGIDVDQIPGGVQLVIAPDSSSNEEEVHKQLKELGIDVLILDHHNADNYSEYACTINNQMCDYPNKSLSGVGIVYKFCQYLDSLLGQNFADNILDLVALGMIADMVDIRPLETKRLLDKGLQNIQNPFFKQMVIKNEFSLGENITPIGVAFYIAPAINAVSRVGSAADKQLLFEAMLDHKADELIESTKRGCKGEMESRVEQACRNCTNLKNQQNRLRDTELERIEHIIERNKLLDNKILIIKLDNSINPNLTGLLANNLANKYQRPCLVLYQGVDDEGRHVWRGSGRNCNGTEFDNLQAFLLDSNYFTLAQGHDNALGVGILVEDLDPFIQYSNEALKNCNFEPVYHVDFILDGPQLNDNMILQIASLQGYWGQKMPEPYIAIRDLRLTDTNLDLLKGTTLKITLNNKNTSLIKFKSSEEEFFELVPRYQGGCTVVDVVGKCTINSWNNQPQIKIEDYEITAYEKFYF